MSYAPQVRVAGTNTDERCIQLRNVYRLQQSAQPADGKYIVCGDINNIFSGLGCCLLALSTAWKYALQTGRTLVIDWRGNAYTRKDPAKNLFPLLFQQPEPSELGVRCIADDSINDLKFPQPILGPAEAITHESGAVHKLPVGGLKKSVMRKLMASGIDVDYPTVIPSLETTFYLANNYGPHEPRGLPVFSFEEGRRLYGSLKPLPQWAAVVSEFSEEHMSSRPVIGVHVRHGNGEGNYRDHFRHREIHDFASFIKDISEKIRRFASGRFGSEYTVFVCSDSDAVVNALQTELGSVVSRRIWRPAVGQGVDFDHAYKQDDGGVGVAADALIDMQLLAKCNAVLMTRETAFAAHVPFILEKPGAIFLNHERTAAI